MEANPSSDFWGSTAGTVTKIAIAAAAVGGVVLYAQSNAAAAATTPAAGSAPGPTSSYYIFNVTTPYQSNIATNLAIVTAALQAAGFSNIVIEPDPTNVDAGGNQYGWVATALYTGTPPTSITNASGNLTLAPVAGSTAITPITGPVAPTTSNVTVGTWYSFAVRTSFLQAATNALAAVQALLQNLGFGTGSTASSPTIYVTPAADMSSTPDTWNVYAIFTGPSGATTAPSQVTDTPPLIFFVPSATPTAMTTAPSGPPPVTMP
jgi:hypothetical protein